MVTNKTEQTITTPALLDRAILAINATLEEDLKALQRNWFFRKYFKERDRKRKE